MFMLEFNIKNNYLFEIFEKFTILILGIFLDYKMQFFYIIHLELVLQDSREEFSFMVFAFFNFFCLFLFQ